MKANELRLGNLIKEKGGEIFPIPSGEYIDDSTMKYYKPICLTEKWLLKLGFQCEYHKKTECWKKYYNRITIIHFYEDGHNMFNGSHYDSLKYVHQLQNLYFVLVGSELAVCHLANNNKQ